MAAAGTILLLSFISGAVLCYGEYLSRRDLPPSWRHQWLTLHGVLTPLICVFYGALWTSHIAGGFKMRANRSSGVSVTIFFSVLILSSLGLYYSNHREFFFWIHIIPGFLLPFALAAHLLLGKRWAGQASKT